MTLKIMVTDSGSFRISDSGKTWRNIPLQAAAGLVYLDSGGKYRKFDPELFPHQKKLLDGVHEMVKKDGRFNGNNKDIATVITMNVLGRKNENGKTLGDMVKEEADRAIASRDNQTV
jgi:hypothetical protein